MLDRVEKKQPIPWYKTLDNYYYRPEWELYDLKMDPQEMSNMAAKKDSAAILKDLQEKLLTWQNQTADPWICGNSAVLQDKGDYKNNPQCLPLYNTPVQLTRFQYS